MSVITAYKSDTDGKLFTNKKKYIAHLRKIGATRAYERKIAAAHKTDQQWWYDNFWNKVRSIPQLQQAILIHAEVFGANGLKNYGKRSGRERPTTPIITQFIEFRFKFSYLASNSHSAPIGGVTNWGRDADRPQGYPGFVGRVSYLVNCGKFTNIYPGGDAFTGTRIHTGSGGGRFHGDWQAFEYDATLFLQDWPGLAASYAEAKEEMEKARTMFILTRGNDTGFTFDLDAAVNSKYPAELY